MKYQKKLQSLFLILAAVVFCGRELAHSAFHACMESRSCACQHYYGVFDKHASEIESADDCAQDVFFKHACPICSSVAAKSTHPYGIETPFTNYVSLIYSQSCDSFSFNSRSKPVSRAPPAV